MGHHLPAARLQTLIGQRLESQFVTVIRCSLWKAEGFISKAHRSDFSRVTRRAGLRCSVSTISWWSVSLTQLVLCEKWYLLLGFTYFVPSPPFWRTNSHAVREVYPCSPSIEKVSMVWAERLDIYLFCISNPECYVVKAEKPALLVLMTRKSWICESPTGFMPCSPGKTEYDTVLKLTNSSFYFYIYFQSFNFSLVYFIIAGYL